MRRGALLCLLVALLLLASAGPAAAATVWAVGDGAGAEAGPDDDQLGAFIASRPIDRFLYLGDVYETGTAAEFRAYYQPAFGRFKAVTAPTPGNHEWGNRAQGYDPYWGPAVRQANGGHYYSFNFAGWHFVSLNSEEPAGPQVAWLRSDLARYRGTCTIAFWHRPRFSAGPQWNTVVTGPLFNAVAGHSVVVLSGHAHNYQRLFPVRGVTQFVVGTGGQDLSAPDRGDPRVAAGAGAVVGALRLDLGLGNARFEFDTSDGDRLDAGNLQCVPHVAPPARVRIIAPKKNKRYRKLAVLRGRTRNARLVRLTLVRVDRPGRNRRRRCRAFDGKRFVRASCRTRLAFSAKGTPAGSPTRWKFRIKRGLQPGDYRLTARVTALDLRKVRRKLRFTVLEPAENNR
jgi:hypothetical protein